MLMVVTDSVERTLTAADRCDACGARAQYAVKLEEGELLFCGHHFTKNEEALINVAIDIYDSSDSFIEPKRPALDTE
jgi:hypothetical protein